MRITVSTPAFLTIATAAKAFASADDVSPVITGSLITVDGALVTALATDRYVAGVVETRDTFDGDNVDGSAIIPTSLLTDAAKRFAKCPTVTLDVVDGVATVSSVSSVDRASAAIITGNFPPIARLFPTPETPWDAAGVGTCISMGKLARLSTVRLPGDRTPAAAKDAGWEFEGQSGGSSAKRGALCFTRTHGATSVRVLVQPNLKRD